MKHTGRMYGLNMPPCVTLDSDSQKDSCAIVTRTPCLTQTLRSNNTLGRCGAAFLLGRPTLQGGPALLPVLGHVDLRNVANTGFEE